MSPLTAAALLALATLGTSASAETLIHGTVFLSPAIVTEEDATAFESVTPAGTAERAMFDRREDGWVDVDAHLFKAVYAEGLCIEFQVNTELGDIEDAQALVDQYAPIIGRLPGYLRRDVTAVWMQPGDELFGGGNNTILIHTGATAEKYIADGVLEEALAHEAAHTSLDATLAESADWLAAQKADDGFISDYAHDHPIREDVAESVVPWIAVCCGDPRVDDETAAQIQRRMPHRIAVFERMIGEWSKAPVYGGKAGCESDGEAPD